MNTIYFDGLCVPNPGGQMFLCVKLNEQFRLDEIGRGTINIAEWSALLWALKLAQQTGLREVQLFGDSQLVVNQANGVWKARHPTLSIMKGEFDEMRSEFRHLIVDYQPRLQNLAATHLEDTLLACATIGPNKTIAAQFTEPVEWPSYTEVKSAIYTGRGRATEIMAVETARKSHR
jgi:ribonuclease HI